MREWILSTLFGALQGLSEFLPISSSGHLVLLHHWVDFKKGDIFFDVFLHLGTLFSIVWIYRKDISEIFKSLAKWIIAVFGLGKKVEGKGWFENLKFYTDVQVKLVFFILIGTIPTGFIGLYFKTPLEAAFSDPLSVAYTYTFTAAALFLTRYFKQGEFDPTLKIPHGLNTWKAIMIGTIQGIAILPGISRSGVTIAMGLLLNIKGKDSARYSFLLSIPAVLGAFLVKLKDLKQIEPTLQLTQIIFEWTNILGFLSALIFGLIAIKLVLKFLKLNRFWLFGFYCIAMSVLAFVMFFLRGQL